MRVLITGGSGFIGTRLATELFAEGHSVKIFDKVASEKFSEVTIVGDVRNLSEVIDATRDIDVVYHLAAEHADDVYPKSLYLDVNVGGARNLSIAALENGVTNIVFTSTVAVYALECHEPSETATASPFNEYGMSKFEAEKVFGEWQLKSSENQLLVLRPAVVFGEGNRGNVYNLARQVSAGRFLMVGSGSNRKSMCYVGNLVSYLTMLAGKEVSSSTINFADKPDLTSAEIVDNVREELGLGKSRIKLPYSLGIVGGFLLDIVAKITGRKFPVSLIRVRKFSADTSVDSGKLFSSGYRPICTLEEGLRRTIRYEFGDS